MTISVRDAFAEQGLACASLGSPFMGRLMPLIGRRLSGSTAVGARCLAWPGDVGPSGHSVPLRLAGALHGLVLDDSAPALAVVYPPHTAADDALWKAVEDALRAHEARILTWLERAPQTNEVRRTAAVIAGLWWALGEVGDRPVILSELGASAGLNLALDRFSVAVDDTVHGPAAAAVALAPLDAATPEDALRLLAYLWPDQPDRLARTRAAIAIAPVRPDADDAAPWLARRLAVPRPGALHAVYTTIAAQYFPDATRASIGENLAMEGALATPDAPLLHIAMEADARTPGAGLTATLWAEGTPLQVRLGRASFHLDWIDWSPAPPETPLYPLVGG